MKLPEALFALTWLVRDTFRQALASRAFWVLLAPTVLCTLFCLAISVEGTGVRKDETELVTDEGVPLTGPNPRPGHIRFLFGAFRAPLHRDVDAEVRLLMTIFGSWVGGSLGVLLALIVTAGFLPDFLHPSSASVMLAKPTPRWLILAGKYLGVVLFIALHALLFFLGTWLGLGTSTGIWRNGYFWGVPLLIVHFAAMYSFSVLLAVVFRRTTACVLGAVLFWLLCYAVNLGRHTAVAHEALAPGANPLSPATAFFIDVAYWVLPKPADLIVLLETALDAAADKVALGSTPEFTQVLAQGAFHPFAIVLSSCLFAALLLPLAGRELEKTDY